MCHKVIAVIDNSHHCCYLFPPPLLFILITVTINSYYGLFKQQIDRPTLSYANRNISAMRFLSTENQC